MRRTSEREMETSCGRGRPGGIVGGGGGEWVSEWIVTGEEWVAAVVVVGDE